MMMKMILYMWKINYIKSPPRLHASYVFQHPQKRKINDEEKSSIKFNFFSLSRQPVSSHIVESAKEGSKFPVVDEQLFSLSQMLQFHSLNALRVCIYFSQIIAPSDVELWVGGVK